ncbi:hypothetical protein [Mesorhizobium sp. WSM2239]|jgi:hypothetical protein|uniref:Uncharacterized protein n=2 Tax=unclassified Mesorhizobium TaxID=325217 RepID=A0AAU8D7N7_9HYPH
MARRTRPNDMPAKRRAAEAGKPAVDQPASDENALEKRIERLERRLEKSVRGNDGLGISRTDRGLDDSETEDALKRAVVRSNIKRGSRKA